MSLLTLNSAGSLPVCLESLKEFAEIIVCDGNSTDATRDIARAFGALIIPQYDTDEPNTPCAMDKTSVRERAMAASTLPWRFFMDADDTLSQEAVAEIRHIVSEKKPSHNVWRMPTRIFITQGKIQKEIKHEATYPSYQTRLVHKNVHASFRGPVHDRLDFDAKKFPVGTMKSFYNFHWPAERTADYWRYIGGYARRELQVMEFKGFKDFLYWSVYRRARTILGYCLWRLPAMYLRHGFRHSMPLGIELIIVRYHCALLFGSIKKYFMTRGWCVVLFETVRGKDLNRTLCNLAVRSWEAYGRVLDVGGGDGASSYWRFMRTRRWHRVTTLDIDPASGADVVLDLEKDHLPFQESHFDTILLFNVLEHVGAGDEVLKKLHAVLRPGGSLLCVVPFLVGVHPNPRDYVRLTDEGLRELFERVGFLNVEITPIGRGPLAASYSQSEFLLPHVLKLIILPLVLVADRLVLRIRPALATKFPLSYALRAAR